MCPLFLGVKISCIPLSRCLRQQVKWDEYSPKLFQKLNQIFDIPVEFQRDAYARKYSLSDKERDLLFDVDEIKSQLMACLDEAHKAGVKGRIEVFDRYCFGSLLRMLQYSFFMTSREFARVLSIHHSSLLGWEMVRNRPCGKMIEMIKLRIGNSV